MSEKTVLLEQLKRILAELDRHGQKMAAIRVAEAIVLLEDSPEAATNGSEKDDPPS